MSFIERLQQAARTQGIGSSQSEIALALGVNRQTVHRWFKGGEPDADQLVRLAKRFNVDAQWLREGAGTPQAKPGGELSQDERELIQNYRQATPKVREVVRMMTRAVRKAILTGIFVIPPMLAPKDAGAFNISKIASQLSQVVDLSTHWLQCALRQVFRRVNWTAGYQGFLTHRSPHAPCSL